MSLYDEFESYLKFKTFAAQETETILLNEVINRLNKFNFNGYKTSF